MSLSRVHRFSDPRRSGQIREQTSYLPRNSSRFHVQLSRFYSWADKSAKETGRRINYVSLRTKRVINKSSFGLHVSHRRNITISGCDLSKQGSPFHDTHRYPGHVRLAEEPRRFPATRLLPEYTEICLSRLMRMHALPLPTRVDREERRSRISSLSLCVDDIRVNIFTFTFERGSGSL